MWTETSLHVVKLMDIVHSSGLMPTEARGNYFHEPPYLRETKTYHSYIAIRVDTTCWQLFRPYINTAHLYFCCCRSCKIT